MNKKQVLKFRCTSLEKAIIEKKAQNSGLSLSAYIRSCSLNQKINFKFTDAELEVYQSLVKFHNNFTRLSNLYKNKDPLFSQESKALAEQIKNHLKKLQ